MKKILFPFIAAVVFLQSCAPVYKCGDVKPAKVPVTWSKNLKTVISERDRLCLSLSNSEKENNALKSNINELKISRDDLSKKLEATIDDKMRLQAKYDNLFSESLSKTDQLSKALILKSEELDNKEKLLSEREKSLEELKKIIAKQDSIANRLNSILKNAFTGFNSDELSTEIINGKIYVSMSDKLLFKSGSASVESKGREALKLLSEVLNKNAEIDILIEGHTDNIPIKTTVFKDNWDLSVARATSIVRILSQDYRITPSRMTASGKGEFFPKSDNDSPEGRAKNRRTEIILSPKLDEIMQILVM